MRAKALAYLLALLLPTLASAQSGIGTPGVPIGSPSGSGGATTLDGLSDTVITSIHAGEVLTHNGTNVINSMTLARGTITTSDPWTFSQTWNAGGVTFVGKSNEITSTASASASVVEQWLVGGTALLQIGKTSTAASPTLRFGDATTGFYKYTTDEVGFATGGTLRVQFGTGAMNLFGYPFTTTSYILGSGTILNRAADATYILGAFDETRITTDGSYIVALRNSTNAHTFNWYYSYTDASNYHRGSLKTSSTGIEIAAETAGTGADNLDITLRPAGSGSLIVPSGQFALSAGYGSSTAGWYVLNKSGFISPSDGIFAPVSWTGAGSAMRITEITAPSAPPTNSVYFYAEDNGSGKTRLMALFPTGAAQQIAIEP